MKRRIAYLTSQYPRASDTFIRTEIKHFRELGFEVDTYSVRCPSRSSMVGNEIQQEHQRTTYLLHGSKRRMLTSMLYFAVRRPGCLFRAMGLTWKTSMPGLVGRFKSLIYLFEAAVLAQAMLKTDIGHLHNHLGENSATVAMLASLLSDIPYSMTIHGPGIFFHPRYWTLGEKIKRSQFTAAISHFCRSQCMVFTEYEAWNKIIIVPCCVDRCFLSKPVTMVPETHRLLFVGRLCEEKGVPILIEATRRLHAAGQVFEVVLIGDGPLRAFIEEQIREHQLEDCIRLLGFQTSERVMDELTKARALILPSFAEGLPVVIMESLGVARPVISTRIAGIPELVDEACGWLVAPSDVESLVTAMQACLSTSREQLLSMGQAGRERVTAKHNPEYSLAPLVAAVKESLDAHRR